MDDTAVKPLLFRARAAIGFTALSKRRLFVGHLNYCSYDTYPLVVQRYRPGETGTFSFSARRRDGSGLHVWDADSFAFQRPRHVDERAKVDFDQPLAQALIELPAESSVDLYEALTEFNAANTDSQDVPPSVEVVMMKSAFEWLQGVNQDSDNFSRALLALLPTADPIEDGPLTVAWRNRFPKASRPIDAWAREFCALRGMSAHGQSRNAAHVVWSRYAHLAFASILFPLIVKVGLAADGHWTLSETDAQKLRFIEAYLMHDPFAHDSIHSTESNPWVELDSRAYLTAWAKNICRNAPGPPEGSGQTG